MHSRQVQKVAGDSESLITALFVPLRAVGVTAPSCLHPSCCSFVVDTQVTFSVMRCLLGLPEFLVSLGGSCLFLAPALTYSVMRRHS